MYKSGYLTIIVFSGNSVLCENECLALLIVPIKENLNENPKCLIQRKVFIKRENVLIQLI